MNAWQLHRVVSDIDHTLKSDNRPWLTPPVPGMVELMCDLRQLIPSLQRQDTIRTMSVEVSCCGKRNDSEDEAVACSAAPFVYLTNRYGPVSSITRGRWCPGTFLKINGFPDHDQLVQRKWTDAVGFLRRSPQHKLDVLQRLLSDGPRHHGQVVVLLGDSVEKDALIFTQHAFVELERRDCERIPTPQTKDLLASTTLPSSSCTYVLGIRLVRSHPISPECLEAHAMFSRKAAERFGLGCDPSPLNEAPLSDIDSWLHSSPVEVQTSGGAIWFTFTDGEQLREKLSRLFPIKRQQ